MTHTLHRLGSRQELEKDFIVFAMAAQNINRDGCAPKLRTVFLKMLEFDPVNFGDMKTGNKFNVGKDVVVANIKDNSIVHAVFRDAATVAKVIGAIKELNTGMCITVSGLFDRVDKCCCENHIQRHTTESSLGVLGRTDLLPPEKIRNITTMCGHGMVAASLVEKMVDEIKLGLKTPDAAAAELARMCHCGIFNAPRAKELLAALVAQ